jgi:hypothetical protein
MDRQELKPCPFCGAREWTIRPAYQVQCPRCGAEGPNGAIPATAKEAWNTRQPDPAEAERDRLREALEKIAKSEPANIGLVRVISFAQQALDESGR